MKELIMKIIQTDLEEVNELYKASLEVKNEQTAEFYQIFHTGEIFALIRILNKLQDELHDDFEK